MKTFELQQGFGLQSVMPAEREIPVPGPHEVLIKIKAASLNFRDLSVVKGFYNPNLQLPHIPASDAVGEVVGAGNGVTQFKLGDRVSPVFYPDWKGGMPERVSLLRTPGGSTDGYLREYAVVHEDEIVHVPQHLTDEEAATLACAGVTAWHATVAEGKVQAGDTVVVQGTGSVSLFALQFAKLHGARVIVTSSSDDKLAEAIKLGADIGINYKTTPDWEAEVLALTEGRGADHVIDVGGAATLNRSLAAIRIGGRVSAVGILTGVIVEGFSILALMQKKPTIQGITTGSKAMFEAMNAAIAAHGLRPVIDRVYPFAEAVSALQDLDQGAANRFGKIVISMR
ncbi:zinc-dependent alcohol dehydrogenase family protein [Paenibacillus sp. MMS18-CY102]|uniref:zinc-dependent alcohol dehydrogenase family protein n=1 Tax=Paenibacillus sp. MMS18-CY102 TaxID=2682849 RepID=UPI0013665936|nr:NAD(P)-dependent alcohol dehydrogenase [Paenibacillus sp. MMS18-CY102]MWC28817.1 zinc-binding dehydrogenase [Paenibacillus sp. MMS18-CY102]